FDLVHPQKSSPALVNLRKRIAALPASSWRDQKLKEVDILIEQCNGLFLDATTSRQTAVLTDSVRIQFTFNSRLGTDVVVEKVSTAGFDSSFSAALSKNRNLAFSRTVPIPANHPVTQPYWLANR